MNTLYTKFGLFEVLIPNIFLKRSFDFIVPFVLGILIFHINRFHHLFNYQVLLLA
jgi:hypothetical protein